MCLTLQHGAGFSPFCLKEQCLAQVVTRPQYGEALSSAVILESIDLPERTAATPLFPLLAGAGIQTLAKIKSHPGVQTTATLTWWPILILCRKLVDYYKMPEFHNADFNYRIKTKSGGMINTIPPSAIANLD